MGSRSSATATARPATQSGLVVGTASSENKSQPRHDQAVGQHEERDKQAIDDALPQHACSARYSESEHDVSQGKTRKDGWKDDIDRGTGALEPGEDQLRK